MYFYNNRLQKIVITIGMIYNLSWCELKNCNVLAINWWKQLACTDDLPWSCDSAAGTKDKREMTTTARIKDVTFRNSANKNSTDVVLIIFDVVMDEKVEGDLKGVDSILCQLPLWPFWNLKSNHSKWVSAVSAVLEMLSDLKTSSVVLGVKHYENSRSWIFSWELESRILSRP